MYCKHCGAEIDNDSIFCSKCGKPLGTNSFVKRNTIDAPDVSESSKPDDIVNVKIIKEKKVSGGKTQKIVKIVLKQILYIGLLIISAFIIKSIPYHISMSRVIPTVTEENQIRFNEEFFKLQNPNGVPSIDELKANNFQRDYSKYPQNTNIPIGLIATEYLLFGDFTYDDKLYSPSQLENINIARKEILEEESESIADTALKIALGILIGGYLLISFIRWLLRNV